LRWMHMHPNKALVNVVQINQSQVGSHFMSHPLSLFYFGQAPGGRQCRHSKLAEHVHWISGSPPTKPITETAWSTRYRDGLYSSPSLNAARGVDTLINYGSYCSRLIPWFAAPIFFILFSSFLKKYLHLDSWVSYFCLRPRGWRRDPWHQGYNVLAPWTMV
jgi:hypothetical protein